MALPGKPSAVTHLRPHEATVLGRVEFFHRLPTPPDVSRAVLRLVTSSSLETYCDRGQGTSRSLSDQWLVDKLVKNERGPGPNSVRR